MRLLFGIVLGCVLTVGGAYLSDSYNAGAAASPPASAQRPMVNWDVVSVKWHTLTERARSQWHRVIANVDAERAVEPVAPRG